MKTRFFCMAALGMIWAAGAQAQPAAHVRVSAELNTSALQVGQQAVVAVVVEIEAGCHAQSHMPTDKNMEASTVSLSGPAGIKVYEPLYPAGETRRDPITGKMSVYAGRVIIYVPLQISDEAKPGDVTLEGKGHFQVCNDLTGVCYLADQPAFSIRTRIVARGQAVEAANAPVFKDFDPTYFSRLTSGGPAANKPASQDAVLGFFGWELHLGAHAYVPIFLCAFVVGILFNLTPCVFPVLPLKIYGFYETAQHNRAKCLALGAVFSLGVVATFGVLALLVLVLGEFSWGEQFSKGWFTLIVVGILLVMGVAMMRDWSVVLPAALYNLAPRHDTMTGNFLMGGVATILSTPCTAPMFLGLLAWAATQPQIVAVGMMLTVGLGMAFPYLVLSAFPDIAKRLPRGGAWGAVVKQVLGFLLLAVAAYFAVARFAAGHIWQIAGIDLGGGRPFWGVFGVMAAGSLWLAVRGVQLSRSGIGIVVSLGIALVLGLAGFWLIRPLTEQTPPIMWQPYTEAAFDKGRESGKVVLVEFTAFWCGNCQALEATVFHDPRVTEEITRLGVVPLRADMTGENPQAKKLLLQLSSAGGIPLTAIYGPGQNRPIQLSSVYASENLLQAIDRAGKK